MARVRGGSGGQLLDDSMMTMSTITSSRFVQGIRAEVEKMETALHAFAKVSSERAVLASPCCAATASSTSGPLHA
jgi:hypothetical protein